MTENDNIKHYIGDLEATSEIDLVFKHIYDLMLANGGEGSNLNADMIDGYHASDFAPATIVQEISQCIHTINISGTEYNGQYVTLILSASDVSAEKNDETITVAEYLRTLNTLTTEHSNHITELQERIAFLDNETANKLEYFADNNLKYVIDENNVNRYYMDSDSVNGLSFVLVTQKQYDVLPKEQKADPRNIFIINNNLDDEFIQSEYTAPSVLKASMDMQLQVNSSTKNIEYSVDGGHSWKVFMPLVGSGIDDAHKGILYPEWFGEVKQAIESNITLQDQNDYPFLLNTSANQAFLQKNPITGIKSNNSNITVANDNGIADIGNILSDNLATLLSADDGAIIKSVIPVDNLELTTHRIEELSENKNHNTYPTSKAVSDYIETIRGSLTNSIRAKADSTHVHSTWTLVTLKKDVAWLWYNPNTKMVQFRYWNQNVNLTSTDAVRIHQGLIPKAYRPHGSTTILPFLSHHQTGFINTSGDMYVSTNKTGKQNINTSAVWCYL